MGKPVVGHRQELYSQFLWGKCYFGFYPSKAHFATAGREPVEKVTVTVLDESEATVADYWAWWRVDDEGNRPDEIAFIYPSEGQVSMCFPYGPEAETARGRGQIIRVRVEKRPD